MKNKETNYGNTLDLYEKAKKIAEREGDVSGGMLVKELSINNYALAVRLVDELLSNRVITPSKLNNNW